MALIGSIAIAMSVEAQKFTKGLAQAKSQLHVFAVSAVSTGRVLSGLFAGGVIAGFYKLSKGAGALSEQTDRAAIDFGDYASEVVEQAGLMATAFGISKKEFIASAAAFAPVFEGARYGAKDVKDLSLALTKLALDLSSKVDVPIAEAMAKLQSGLAGEIQPLRELGISMTVANAQAYAYAHGIAKLGAELTESQKVQARVGYIFQESKKILGNLSITSEGYGNITRSLSGRIENLANTLGSTLNKVIGPAVGELTVGIQALQIAWDASAFASLSATNTALAGAQAQTQSIGFVQKAIGFVADEWQVVGLAFTGVQVIVTSGIAIMINSLRSLATAVDMIGSAFGQDIGAGSFFKTWAEDLDRLKDNQLANFNKELARPPASEGIDRFFADARAKILEARKELLKPGVDVTKLTPQADMAAKATGNAIKLASVQSINSQEGVNTILRSRYGAGQSTANKPVEQTAKNTAKTNDLLSQMVGILKGGKSLPDQTGQVIGTLLGNF